MQEVCGAWCKGTGLGGKGRIGTKAMDAVNKWPRLNWDSSVSTEELGCGLRCSNGGIMDIVGVIEGRRDHRLLWALMLP